MFLGQGFFDRTNAWFDGVVLKVGLKLAQKIGLVPRFLVFNPVI
ncbi:hypothetical protein M23134_06964 [Microscilla marina ATCC 23134]|uniref:Uncharacterized protein n=1 Tax=Microscilla marina ATCC 23134 TaxID=313606 RepID=A1ZYH7_MICM2|nr:hypothetical protein M23134_06964 [Microscilla marina ATCC 23134]